MKRRFLLIIFLISIIYFLSASSIYATDIDAQYNSNELSIESPNLNINTKDIDCESLNSNVYSNNNIDNSNLENSDDQPQIASNSMEADDFDHVSLNSNNKIDDSNLENSDDQPQIASNSMEADDFDHVSLNSNNKIDDSDLENSDDQPQIASNSMEADDFDHVSLNSNNKIDDSDLESIESISVNGKPQIASISDDNQSTIIEADNFEIYFKNGTAFEATLLDNNGNPISNQTINLQIAGVNYERVSDLNGTIRFSINLNPGTYNLTISFTGNETYLPCQTMVTVTVLPTISGDDVVKYYRNGTQYYASFLDNDGRVLSNTNVTFNINGVFYTRTTDENGTAMLSINLNPASYIITAINPINNESYSNNITVLPTIYGSDIVMYYRNGTQYYASFLDNDGRALSNTNVTFNINGVFYTRTTDENGTAALSINLNPAVYIITAINPINNEQYSNTITVLANETTTTTTTNGNGYWVQGKDMNNVNLASLASQGVGNIFLNFYAFTLYGESAVLQWIDQANKNNIKVHIWVQSFYDGGWNSPVLSDGTPNYSLFNKKIDEIKYYAALKGVKGIHLDYLRFPGTAYKHTGGTEAINTFVKSVSEAVRAINPNLILSAAVMPEKSSDPYYYGQDVTVLGKYLDVIVPMVYKGNYNAGSSWITSTTKWFVENSQGAQIWTGLQTYNSDSDISRLSLSALTTDAQAAINGGATGAMMFRYGVCNFINFNNLNYPNNSKITTTTSVTNRAISMSDIQNAASTLKQNIEKNGILPSSVSSNENTFTIPQLLYLMSQYVDNFGSNMTFDIMSLSSPSNSTGDILYGEVFKSEYSSMAESLINYIKSNNKAPDYMNSSLGKINYDNLVYTFSKLVDYMSKYGIAPEYVYVASYLNYPSLTVTMLPSNSNEYDHIYYTTTWLNYCPNCGYYGSLLINPKGTVEGELTCAFCDSDYCGVSGNEKVSNPFSVLTRISDSQPSNTSNPSSANGNSQGSVNNIPSSISLNSILNAAVNLKSYIENHDDLPDRVSIDNFDVSLSQFLYLMCVAVKNIYNSNFNNINWVNVSSTVDPSGSTISARLLKDDYYDVAVRVANFILEYNRAPNYASSTVGNIIYDELIDAFSRVLAYYKNNNALPNYVQISTSASQMISSLVKSLTNGITTDYGKAEALFNWVRDKISYQFYYNTQKGADLTLSSRAGNCCDQAQLLVAMARSAGLTIRFATGNCRFSSGSVYGHVWTQFYLNGKWVIADPTSSRNSLGSVKNWNTNTYTSKGTYDVLPY